MQLDTVITTTTGRSVVVAHTSEDVFDSKTGQVLVIPRFSRLLGHAAASAASGESRVVVGWDRMILIDGSYKDFKYQEGADRESNNGLFADVQRPNVIATSILTGLIAGSSRLLARGASAGSTVKVGGGSLIGSSCSSLAQAGGQLIEKKAGEPTEFTVPRAQRFSVIFDRSMLLEPWHFDDTAATDK